MATTEQLRAEATTMQRYLEELCPADPAQINERIRTLQVYMARSGEMLAQAKDCPNDCQDRPRGAPLGQSPKCIGR